MSRSAWVAAFALMLLAAGSVRADLPGPWPWSKATGPRNLQRYGNDLPTDQTPAPQPPIEPVTVKAQPDPREEKPRCNGPFRSCGSGAGTGLAAIGISWGLLWLGNRFVGRVRGTKD